MQALSVDYCEQNRTKSASRGYKTICPDCGGKNLWVTTNNNRAYCFECSASYKIGEDKEQKVYQIKKLDIENIRKIYTEAIWEYRNALQQEHKEYLKRRGIDQQFIDLFSIGYCPLKYLTVYQTQYAKDAGLFYKEPFLSERIIFPYIAAKQIIDMRGRCLDNSEPRYKSPYNQSSARGAIYPFNYDRANERAKTTKTLLITEGEIKAVVADIYGFAAMALPGISTWRPGFINESNARIIIIFDNSPDIGDKLRIDKSIQKFAKYLPYFYVAVLPLLGEQKMDLDTFLLHKNGGEKRLQDIIDSALEYNKYLLLRKF